MTRYIWDALQIIGALASIIALIVFLREQPTLSLTLVVILVLGVFAVIVASVMARRGPQRPVGRNAMIATGKRLIRNVKKQGVMFGGDMSWASDYEDAIRTVTNSGKKIIVLYPASTAQRVRRNAEILKEAGAELFPTPIDSGLRALLVDPDDSKDALLYVVTRALRTQGVPVQVGEQGSEINYRYLAKIYTMERDWVIVQAARKIHEVFSTPYRGSNDG